MMTRLHRRLEAARAADEGVSLIELMVAAFLSTLIMAAICTMFIVVAKQTLASQGTRLSTADASNIVNVVSTTIRASINNAVQGHDDPDPAIVSASSTTLVVISYTDAGPSFETPLQIRYQIVGGRMTEDRWQPTIVQGYAVFPALTATPYQTRTLGNVVVNTAAEPLFKYYNGAGVEQVPGTVVAGATVLSLAQRQATTSVKFDVKVRAADSHQVVEVQNNVGMPNMALSQNGG
jgi:Tfp pilus assembly protein PilW